MHDVDTTCRDTALLGGSDRTSDTAGPEMKDKYAEGESILVALHDKYHRDVVPPNREIESNLYRVGEEYLNCNLTYVVWLSPKKEIRYILHNSLEGGQQGRCAPDHTGLLVEVIGYSNASVYKLAQLATGRRSRMSRNMKNLLTVFNGIGLQRYTQVLPTVTKLKPLVMQSLCLS